MVDNHSRCWPSSHLKHETDVGRRDLLIPKTGRSIDEASFVALPSKAYFSQTLIRLPSPKPSLPRLVNESLGNVLIRVFAMAHLAFSFRSHPRSLIRIA